MSTEPRPVRDRHGLLLHVRVFATCHPVRIADNQPAGEELPCAFAFFYFPTDYGINIAALWRGPRRRGLGLALRAGAHPHPNQPAQFPFRADGELPKKYSQTTTRFCVRPFGACCVDQNLLVGTGHLFVSRSATDRQNRQCIASRDQLSGAVGWPFHFRYLARVERRGNVEPRAPANETRSR